MTHTEYRYSVAGPTADYRPGDTVPLVWKATPTLAPGSPSVTSARLCVALVGPYGDVAALKASHVAPRDCPVAVPGTVIASETAAADLGIGAPVDQSIALPRTLAPGYYDVISVLVYGASGTGNSQSAAGILHVVAAP